MITGFGGLGASREDSSVTSESAIQSESPDLQQRESGPISPPFQRRLSRSTVSGPSCFSSIATNHSCSIGGASLGSGVGSAARLNPSMPPPKLPPVAPGGSAMLPDAIGADPLVASEPVDSTS